MTEKMKGPFLTNPDDAGAIEMDIELPSGGVSFEHQVAWMARAIESIGVLKYFDSSEETKRLRRMIEKNPSRQKITVNRGDLAKVLNDLAHNGAENRGSK